MSGTLALASAIAEMDRDTLVALVRSRRPHAPASIIDPIGLASDLLKVESITRALAPLDRTRLDAVRDPAGADAVLVTELIGLGLLGREAGEPVRLPEVELVLGEALGDGEHGSASVNSPEGAGGGAWRAADPESDVPSQEAGGAATAPHADTSAWFTSALTAVGQSAECLRTLRDRPGKLNRSGSIAVATVKQLADTTGVEPDGVALALAALLRAGLVTTLEADQLLITTAASGTWLELTHVHRWIALAQAAARTMPAPLRIEWEAAAETEADLRRIAASIPRRYPLLPPAELAAVNDFVRAAEFLGLTLKGRFTAVADATLAGAGDVSKAVATAMPATADGVYVQPDLSVVVPGPLAPHDEAVLAALARPEHIGVATTRRITEASIAEAYERGLTPDSAREAFARISLTGIPQPLEYLLSSLGERVGGIVVGDYIGDEGRTRITLARPDIAATLVVDRALQHLQLQRSRTSDTVLYSRLSPDHVLAALADARYHASSQAAVLREGVGSAQQVDASKVDAPAPQRSPEVHDVLDALAERVFVAARSEPGTGDFTRRLELAIRDRSAVLVTAEARGEVRTFTLLPVSVNAGRLRAADQAAGVERTLPVSMITAVEPA
ncbi:helicase-associated domain-containing protein [Leucobacter sp. NPDC058333]|uniref:helicase-associated domain-containing protein n=1 Tax=Leucobacter sp. NPDC058333 TaxID=3346450 RepID=UPI003663DF2B